MLSTLKKHNTRDYDCDNNDSVLTNRLVEDYEYFSKEIKINDEIIKKIFVVDITTMKTELIDSLFSDFEEFKEFNKYL